MALFLSMISYAQTSQNCTNDSFAPVPGEKYILSAWVKDDVANQVISYEGKIEIINLYEGGSQTFTQLPKGAIIDGWQQITFEFDLHIDTISLEIKLISMNGGISYFDDIRLFPYNGNLKSFVYDPITQRLMAELDENNYATFYEYDKEGGLIRVKKETERGIFTIQETRSGNSKNQN